MSSVDAPASLETSTEDEPQNAPFAPTPFHLIAAALLVLCVGMYLSSRIYFITDFVIYWLPWAQSTGGSAPWRMYLQTFPTEVGPASCNYPPFVPLLLTAAEAVRRATGAGEGSDPAIFYVKLPFLLSHLAGAAVCSWALRPLVGAEKARWAALAYLFCAGVFVNVAIWGQADALLALAGLGAAGALLRGRPVLAGAIVGWGLTVKLQMIAVVPVLLIWTLRRFGWRAVLQGMAAGLAVIALLVLPYVLNGAGEGVLRAYVGAVTYYPFRQVNMHNGWFLLDMFDFYVRDLPGSWLRPDTTRILGPITWRHLGLLTFGLYQIALCRLVWRRTPTPRLLLLAGIMSVFSFTMLPTQMHERYLLPAVALAALGLHLSPAARFLFFYLSLSLALDQYLVVVWTNGNVTGTNSPLMYTLRAWVGVVLSVGYIVLFVWATRALLRETRAEADKEVPAPS